MVSRCNVRQLLTAGYRAAARSIFLVACLVIGLLCHPLDLLSDGSDPPDGPLTKEGVVRLTNEVRNAHGLQGLSENQILHGIAEERAKDMFQNGYFGHVSSTGERASDAALKAGYGYRIIAENIAQGLFPTSQRLISRWMQSPGHRKNILTPEIRDVGVAIIKGNVHGEVRLLVVQVFGLQSSQVGPTSSDKPRHFVANGGLPN
jgi:uncharacterized protein YkwD